MKQYSTIKQKEGLLHPTTRMSLENIKLSESARHQGHIPYDSTFRNAHRSTEMESRSVVAKGRQE